MSDETLWCVHVLGADELIRCSCYEEACEMAQDISARKLRDPWVVGNVVPWVDDGDLYAGPGGARDREAGE